MWPTDQLYEHGSEKLFLQIELFACCVRNQIFGFICSSRFGVMKGLYIFAKTSLVRNVGNARWLDNALEDLVTFVFHVHPHLPRDYAFFLNVNLIKTVLEQENTAFSC